MTKKYKSATKNISKQYLASIENFVVDRNITFFSSSQA